MPPRPASGGANGRIVDENVPVRPDRDNRTMVVGAPNTPPEPSGAKAEAEHDAPASIQYCGGWIDRRTDHWRVGARRRVVPIACHWRVQVRDAG